ncbi:hypothetical protein BCR43DRAFT_485151 [Syncephalastrum racemosum]|uniref:Uncharacterized protein n=1 Tax=Syncephalastrum racemosum TaxID=13706 RepID=A0A1X2HM89_SYNRA|nr:hypothetical protein BCR43DRAFT_485151 [Syncephalastrum racemosum]
MHRHRLRRSSLSKQITIKVLLTRSTTATTTIPRSLLMLAISSLRILPLKPALMATVMVMRAAPVSTPPARTTPCICCLIWADNSIHSTTHLISAWARSHTSNIHPPPHLLRRHPTRTIKPFPSYNVDFPACTYLSPLQFCVKRQYSCLAFFLHSL